MRCLLYYITDRMQFPGDEDVRRRSLLEKIAEAARCGVDFIQLREKDLPVRDLELLAREALEIIRRETRNKKPETRFLVNSRSDVAVAIGADGVHLPVDDLSPREARSIWRKSGIPRSEIVTISCHSEEEVGRAAAEGADFALFAPVFEKKGAPGTHPAGLEALRRACQHEIPVLALGGITLNNARSCLEAGAAGIAAIRLFQENDIRTAVEALRYP